MSERNNIMKKVIVWMFAVLMGQMVVVSGVDLYRGGLFCINDQKNHEWNEMRKILLSLSTVLDGFQDQRQ